ncbi:MAG TPA: 16S rRNA (cytosine(1402)-N(4))-methyltransferase, partial [Herpetosiphonaceae bacterium]
EERRSRRLAAEVVKVRRATPFRTSDDLLNVLNRTLGPRTEAQDKARIFQALRIAVNDELGVLEKGLEGALQVLRPGGRLAVITFHSLEDRIAKEWIRREASACLIPPKIEILACPHIAAAGAGPRRCVYPVARDCDYAPRLAPVQRKPVEAAEAELNANPRARSAKLRVAERLAGAPAGS